MVEPRRCDKSMQ